MREVITGIEEDADFGRYEGFLIHTTEQTIKVGISAEQDCCENFGYVHSEDDLQEFVGATLLEVKLTDTALERVPVRDVYEGDIMFVTFGTDRGEFQLVTYNEHNGYYGHHSVLVSNQLNHDEVL